MLKSAQFIPQEEENLDFITYVLDIEDDKGRASKVAINSVSFLLGGIMHQEDAKKEGKPISIEEATSNCFLEILDSIEEDYKILNIR